MRAVLAPLRDRCASCARISTKAGSAPSINSSGDLQAPLDFLAHGVFTHHVLATGRCDALASEESEHILTPEIQYANPEISCKRARDEGNGFSVVVDPLDGSGNIDCGVGVGTIFGIYPPLEVAASLKARVLRPARQLCAAGYCLYGAHTALVVAVGGGRPRVFTLCPKTRRFLSVAGEAGELCCPAAGPTYSCNEAQAHEWDGKVREFIDQRKMAGGRLRYVGSMVADVHRTLLQGGVFLYPHTPTRPHGKLRLLYECGPLAYVATSAGGKAIVVDSGEEVLDAVPTGLHARCPVLMGGSSDVEHFLSILEKSLPP